MIEAVLSSIDGTVADIAETTFGSLAGDVAALVIPLGMIGFLILTINMIAQLLPMNGGAYLAWAARFMIVTSAATSWAYFQPIYDTIIALPDGISGLLMGGASMTSGLQNTVGQLFEAYDSMQSSAGYNVGLHITALMIGAVAIALTCAAILVIGIAKMGLAISLGLAPIFIITLLFKSTQDLFGAWSKFVLNFAMILILTAGIIGVITVLLTQFSHDANSAAGLEDMLGLLVIAISSIFFIIQVPNYAMALSGSMAVAGVSLTAAAKGATGAAGATASGAGSAASGAVGGAALLASTARAVKASRSKGESPLKAAREGARAFNETRVHARTAGSAARMVDANAKRKKDDK